MTSNLIYSSDAKFRFAFFKDNKIKICNRNFILNDNHKVGQYISSNWFKQKILHHEHKYLFVIYYNNEKILSNIGNNLLENENDMLNYAYDNDNIIGTFKLNYQNINENSLSIESVKHHKMVNIHKNQLNISLNVSIVKDKHSQLYLYAPLFEIV